MFELRKIEKKDAEWIECLLTEQWSSPQIVRKGKITDASKLQGFVALASENYLGLVTYQICSGELEVVTLNSLLEQRGIGTKLLTACLNRAKAENLRRVWLITTNDNIDALCFYQKRGFTIKQIYRNALIESRKLKPSIPQKGYYDIPLRDEIELELVL